MEENQNKKPLPQGDDRPQRKGPRFNIYWVYGIIFITLIILNFFGGNFNTTTAKNMSFQQFRDEFLYQGKVDRVNVIKNTDVEVYLTPEAKAQSAADNIEKTGTGPAFTFPIGSNDQFSSDWNAAIDKKPETVKEPSVTWSDPQSNWVRELLGSFIVPILIMIAIWFLIMRKMGGGAPGGGAGGIFNIGKSKAQLYEKGTKVTITFNDVAGLDEAKVEVMEIVDFLKNPKKYTALGGKIPKGALLVGPPGTGKTLLAKAVAGEAQVPFFSMSGSDFVELFVGVGASRVRDLFKQAREKSPCIVFIDEIDAIGRARGKNVVMSNDERENTLNQMLVEMDGFSGDSGIIVLAATNRPDVLDSALLRPGRFDRQISIDIPDVKGREKIFEVHLKPIKIAKDLNIHRLAVQTPGFAGADIANICNEAALIAARKGKDSVTMDDFNDAIDRVIGGLEKKNKIILPEEKKVIAYHEAGHAVSGWFLEHAHPLVKVTIVPRGVAALGYAQYLPKEMYIRNTDHLMDDMCMSLGGRAVEELVFGKVSTGALSDLQHVTRMAYAMVSMYGMNDVLGNVSFYDPNSDQSFTKPYSEETGKLIDEESRKVIERAYNRVKALLTEKMESVKIIAEELLKKEVLYKDDLDRLIGRRPYEDPLVNEEMQITPPLSGGLGNTPIIS
ncbi:MAG TPA: ATP-dependent zinc metalloprotease FtsH [Flavipsychrobacter sp.]|nr:ATP-dependent zinc metalloprotease FtsH [Flavipsychrobacter sp.]